MNTYISRPRCQQANKNTATSIGLIPPNNPPTCPSTIEADGWGGGSLRYSPFSTEVRLSSGLGTTEADGGGRVPLRYSPFSREVGLSSDFCSPEGEGEGGGSGPPAALLGDTGLLGGGELPSNGFVVFDLDACGPWSKSEEAALHSVITRNYLRRGWRRDEREGKHKEFHSLLARYWACYQNN